MAPGTGTREPCRLWVIARAGRCGAGFVARAAAGASRAWSATTPAAFERRPPADAVLVCASGRERLRDVLALAPDVRWVHIRSAGVDGSLYPELADRPLVVTNGRGVFSRSLAEFAMAAVFHFAKDLRRLMRNQDRRAVGKDIRPSW